MHVNSYTYLFIYIYLFIHLLYRLRRPPRSNVFHSFPRGWSMVRYRSRSNHNLYRCNKKGCNDNAKKIKARPTWL